MEEVEASWIIPLHPFPEIRAFREKATGLNYAILSHFSSPSIYSHTQSYYACTLTRAYLNTYVQFMYAHVCSHIHMSPDRCGHLQTNHLNTKRENSFSYLVSKILYYTYYTSLHCQSCCFLLNKSVEIIIIIIRNFIQQCIMSNFLMTTFSFE